MSDLQIANRLPCAYASACSVKLALGVQQTMSLGLRAQSKEPNFKVVA